MGAPVPFKCHHLSWERILAFWTTRCSRLTSHLPRARPSMEHSCREPWFLSAGHVCRDRVCVLGVPCSRAVAPPAPLVGGDICAGTVGSHGNLQCDCSTTGSLLVFPNSVTLASLPRRENPVPTPDAFTRLPATGFTPAGGGNMAQTHEVGVSLQLLLSPDCVHRGSTLRAWD